MGEFAGWDMPIQYPPGILAEHEHTRTKASLFDICHMGELRVTGADAAAALDHALGRPVLDQKPGTCRYSFLLTEAGGVLDDLIVYRIGDQEFLLVVNAANAANDANVLRSRLLPGSALADESAETAKLDLQGPASRDVLKALGAEKLPRRFRWMRVPLQGLDLLVSRTGYTGELGYEIYAPTDRALELWDLLLSHELVQPAGLGARDTLRLEAGYPLHGHDLSVETTPVEAGFTPLLGAPEREFVGSVCRTATPRYHLTGLVLETRRAARPDTPVWDAQGERAGVVTSGSFAPSLGYAVAMAYIDGPAPPEPGTVYHLGKTPARTLAARVEPMPFYKHGSLRD